MWISSNSGCRHYGTRELKTTTWRSSNNSKDPNRGIRVEDNDVDIEQLQGSSPWNERVEDNDVNIIQQLHKDPHRGTRVEDNDVDIIQ